MTKFPNAPNPDELSGVMIDIETLDTTQTAVVLSIAAVAFELTPEGPHFDESGLWLLSLNEQLAAGRTISESTLQFWRDQSDDARAHWRDGIPQKVDLVLDKLSSYITSRDVKNIWANGITFDIGIVESLYREQGIKLPWRYSAARDSRTLTRVMPRMRVKAELAEGTLHDPVSDCLNQIWSVWEHWPFDVMALPEERDALLKLRTGAL